jgi:hypothetical protein
MSLTYCFPEACTHFFEGNEGTLFDMSGTSVDKEASSFRKALMEDFSLGFRRFTYPPMMDAPPRYQGYAKMAVGSRRYLV